MNESITNDDYAQQTDLDDLEARIRELEAKIEELGDEGSPEQRVNIACGYAVGSALAIVLSWSRNASILWGILHGFLSWFYVIYFALTR